MKKCMAQVDPVKEPGTVKKLNEVVTLLFKKYHVLLSKINDCKCFLKNIYCLYKKLIIQIDLLDSNSSQNVLYPERKLRL